MSDVEKFKNAHELLEKAAAVEETLHRARTPPGGVPITRSTPPGAWRMQASSRVLTDMKTMIGLVVFGAAAAAIYFKMPSAGQIAAIDAKHEAARKLLQTQVDSNTEAIDTMSGQVGFLVQIKVAEAGRDPVKRRTIRAAAHKAQQALPTATASDPLAGTDLEQ